MTKGEIIDQAFIQVTGGVLSQDSNVKRFEIANMLPPVMADMMKQAQYRDRAEARAEMAMTRMGPSYAPPLEYYKELVVTPVKDEVTCQYYLPLPKLLDLPYNWNVANVRVSGSFMVDVIRAKNHSELIGLPNIGQMFYWVVNEGYGHKMWLSMVNLPVQPLVVTAVVSPDALEDDDEVPCPPSVEHSVISLLVDRYRAQRGMPADSVVDDSDINEKQ